MLHALAPVRRAALATACAALGALSAGAGPARAQAVRIPFPQDDGTLTPYTFELGYGLMTLVYDTLTWRDADGAPQPWLARSVTRSADGRRVVVRLRDGARWHDGRAVTAADVAFTFRYVRRRVHPRFTPQLHDLAGARRLDGQTVEFRLRRPSPGFADQPLADVPILPRHLWADVPASALAPDGPPVGSGPYRLAGRLPGGGYRFRAVPGHFRGRPAVAAIDVSIVPNADRMLEDLRRRRVDMVPLPLPPAREDEVDGLGILVARGALYAPTVLVLNVREPPFSSGSARVAVAAALDVRRVGQAGVPAVRGVLHPDSRWAPRTPPARPTGGSSPASASPCSRPPTTPCGSTRPAASCSRQRREGAAAEVRAVSRSSLGRAVGEDGHPAAFAAAVYGSSPLPSYDPAFLRAELGSRGSLNRSGYRRGRRVARARPLPRGPRRRSSSSTSSTPSAPGAPSRRPPARRTSASRPSTRS